MIRRPPRSTRTDTLFPYTTLFRSPRVRLLQIGDLHLPTAARTERTVDQKDRTFSVELRNVISRQPIKTVFKRIYRMCEDKNVDGILLMGDMTDFGKLDGYKAGLAYVANALQLGGTRRNASTFCGIVPSNHAIDRALAKKPSMLAKIGRAHVCTPVTNA